jgi:hypothetical protein
MPQSLGVADQNLNSGQKQTGSAGQGRVRKHGVEPVVIGLVRRMVRGMYWMVQSAKAGFGRLSNGSMSIRARVLSIWLMRVCKGLNGMFWFGGISN